MVHETKSRRSVLKSTGVAGVAGLTASLAGCVSSDDSAAAEELGDPVPEITYVIPTEGANPQRNEMSQLIAANFEAIGLDVDLNPVDFETHVEIGLVEHDFDVSTLGWGGTPERIDPHTFIYDLHHGDMTDPGQRNSPGYDNPAYNEIAEAQLTTVDESERQDLVYEAQEILARDQPRCYIANEDDKNPYRTDTFSTVVPTMGEGLNSFWNMVEAEPAGGNDTLRFGYSTEITSLNPMRDMATPDRQFVRLVYDRLYRVNDEGVPEPWAAADDPTFEDGGETVVVPIREGMTFHDGEPVTAEDVAWSFEYFGEHSDTYSGRMDDVEEVSVTGDNEVTFHLVEPYAPFVANVLAQIYIFPQHIWGDIDDPVSDGDDEYVGSGPFAFDEWRLEEELRFDAYQDHFNPPNVDRLVRVPGSDTSTLVRMLENGEIDMVGNTPSPSAQGRLDEDPDIEQVHSPTIAWVKIAYNMRRDVMQDVHFRRALSYCVPKQVMVDDILDGVGTVTHSPIAEVNEFWHNPDVEQFHEDLEAAEAELEAGGYGWDDDGRLYYTEEHEPRMFYDD